MTQAPTWFCPPGHPREAQLQADWQRIARDRRKGGRAMRFVSLPVGARALQADLERVFRSC